MDKAKKPPSKEEFNAFIDSIIDPQREAPKNQPEPVAKKPSKPSSAWKGSKWQSLFEHIYNEAK
jgi:hypothetical protein